MSVHAAIGRPAFVQQYLLSTNLTEPNALASGIYLFGLDSEAPEASANGSNKLSGIERLPSDEILDQLGRIR
jgi:hypothetical protein